MKTCVYRDFVCVSCGVLTDREDAIRACPFVVTRNQPSVIEKLKSFATAAVSHIAAGMPMASDAEIIRRHDICLTCEHLKDNACSLCGCPVSRVAGYVSKLSWADQECPAGKWGKSTPSA